MKIFKTFRKIISDIKQDTMLYLTVFYLIRKLKYTNLFYFELSTLHLRLSSANLEERKIKIDYWLKICLKKQLHSKMLNLKNNLQT